MNPDRVKKVIVAIEAGDAKTVRMMLKAGVPANHVVTGSSEKDRCSLAHYAAKHGQFEIFELLVAGGASMHEVEEYSWRAPTTMLESACSANSPSLEIIRKVLMEAQPNAASLNQALILAAYGQLEVVQELLNAGADPNFTDSSLDTPLAIAVLADREDIAVRLVQAGADATQTIRNKDRSPFWKASIEMIASQKNMNHLLELLPSEAPGASKPKIERPRKPKSVEACWRAIERWLSRHAPDTRLPPAFDWSQPQHGIELLHNPAASQVRDSLSCHDGTGDFSMIVVPADSAYTMLSVEAARSIREMIRDVSSSERSGSNSTWWPETCWPIADNGAGDLLVVECGPNDSSGPLLLFSHETRQLSPYKQSILDLLQEIVVDLESGSLKLDCDNRGLE